MEHLTKNTEYQEYPDWCHRCQKFTQHRRRPGQRGGVCVEPHQPTANQLQNEARHRAITIRRAQGKLFGDRP